MSKQALERYHLIHVINFVSLQTLAAIITFQHPKPIITETAAPIAPYIGTSVKSNIKLIINAAIDDINAGFSFPVIFKTSATEPINALSKAPRHRITRTG